ncbi:MAG TPA: AIR synthase-related protein [Clostridia bacterium]|jgi:hydrogenase expression/formation protein HypE|nr:AIR synthase-related protein [Clostridia bacterium]
MRYGKLTSDELKYSVLDVVKRRRKEVVCSAALGEDCASFKSDKLLLISTDPITGTTVDIGSLSIKVASNDIYAAGGEPLLATVTIIAPPFESVESIKQIMIEAEKEAAKHNLEIVGGHTEFSDAVNRIVVSVTVVGLTNNHIKATAPEIGDKILVTKSIGLEGSVILAEEHYNKLHLSPAEKAELSSYSDNISIAKEAKLLSTLPVSSMHDITEGGVLGAVAEVCEGAHLGAKIYIDLIPVTKLTKKICDELDINPYGLISSGSLLITTKQPNLVQSKLKELNVDSKVVGEIVEGKPEAIYPDGKVAPIKTKPDQLFSKK